MPKKGYKKAKAEEVEEEEVEVEIELVAPITTDFGREDLNLLRDKINEIAKLL